MEPSASSLSAHSVTLGPESWPTADTSPSEILNTPAPWSRSRPAKSSSIPSRTPSLIPILPFPSWRGRSPTPGPGPPDCAREGEAAKTLQARKGSWWLSPWWTLQGGQGCAAGRRSYGRWCRLLQTFKDYEKKIQEKMLTNMIVLYSH